jgi:hypothetical protein
LYSSKVQFRRAGIFNTNISSAIQWVTRALPPVY